MLDQAKKIVLDYAKRSYQEGLFAGTSGNLSVYDREAGLMAITPSGIDYTTMTLEDVVVMDLDGNVAEGARKPSSEWRMHAKVYAEKPEAAAVVHTHSPYATSFAVNHEEIPVILVEMLPFLGGAVRVADFAIPGTDKVGEAAVTALHNRLCCLLANHGVLAFGRNMERAHISAVYVEDAAKIYALAKTSGTPQLIVGENLALLKEKHHIAED